VIWFDIDVDVLEDKWEWTMVDFKKIGEKDWEKYPVPQIIKPLNRWDEVLGVLEAGEIVEIPAPEEKLRGMRIGLARSASTRGFKLDFRYTDGSLAVRRSDKELPVKEPKERKPRTRKSKDEAE
jgi:hypothetical protein